MKKELYEIIDENARTAKIIGRNKLKHWYIGKELSGKGFITDKGYKDLIALRADDVVESVEYEDCKDFAVGFDFTGCTSLKSIKFSSYTTLFDFNSVRGCTALRELNFELCDEPTPIESVERTYGFLCYDKSLIQKISVQEGKKPFSILWSEGNAGLNWVETMTIKNVGTVIIDSRMLDIYNYRIEGDTIVFTVKPIVKAVWDEASKRAKPLQIHTFKEWVSMNSKESCNPVILREWSFAKTIIVKGPEAVEFDTTLRGITLPNLEYLRITQDSDSNFSYLHNSFFPRLKSLTINRKPKEMARHLVVPLCPNATVDITDFMQSRNVSHITLERLLGLNSMQIKAQEPTKLEVRCKSLKMKDFVIDLEDWIASFAADKSLLPMNLIKFYNVLLDGANDMVTLGEPIEEEVEETSLF